VVVVEKDSVFTKLVQERVFDQLPCVLVTAKGFPDLATRVFLKRLQQSFPRITLLALVVSGGRGSVHTGACARYHLAPGHFSA